MEYILYVRFDYFWNIDNSMFINLRFKQINFELIRNIFLYEILIMDDIWFYIC